jgi:hypothetical protein
MKRRVNSRRPKTQRVVLIVPRRLHARQEEVMMTSAGGLKSLTKVQVAMLPRLKLRQLKNK